MSETIDSVAEKIAELNEEELVEEERTPDALTPGPDAPAEPYYAIMVTDGEGTTTGQLWTFSGKMMVFKLEETAQTVLAAVKGGDTHWEIRGVSKEHLAGLRQVGAANQIPIFVVLGLTEQGKVEAVPLPNPAMKPPPLPPLAAGGAHDEDVVAPEVVSDSEETDEKPEAESSDRASEESEDGADDENE
ncbi:MAG: hypothetical protein AUK47_09960 [Deltaproteobacteria bacterium CG2_30_63_29]|nr:MAG: hypothetical protein AUK47_09960 [Deltaproteobacteria bacterium CG2_30_63_29]PJB48082.1 MAG: hypothetical protein CO108_03015 [Deltaproteobacteria bacterium CG_4_9_14_3_um_filter_63_12]